MTQINRHDQSVAQIPFKDMDLMATAIAKSNLFGMKTKDQALSLMLISQAEGRHPASAAQDYDIIQGKPSIKAERLLAKFQMAGGKVEWKEYSDEKVTGVFSHPQGGSVSITWDMDKAERAHVIKREDGKILQYTKDGWKVGNYHKYGAPMLRSRCISEGVRTCFPACTSGMYVPEEVRHFDDKDYPQDTVEQEAEAVVMATEDQINTFWKCVESDALMVPENLVNEIKSESGIPEDRLRKIYSEVRKQLTQSNADDMMGEE